MQISNAGFISLRLPCGMFDPEANARCNINQTGFIVQRSVLIGYTIIYSRPIR